MQYYERIKSYEDIFVDKSKDSNMMCDWEYIEVLILCYKNQILLLLLL